MMLLLVDLVERTGVLETGVPDLVNDLGGLYVILATWSVHDRTDGAVADAVLVLLGDGEVVADEELAGPSALAAQT